MQQTHFRITGGGAQVYDVRTGQQFGRLEWRGSREMGGMSDKRLRKTASCRLGE